MKEKMQVGLLGLKFYAYIGVFPQERKVGNTFVVNLKVSYEVSRPNEDSLDGGISYADIYDVVHDEMTDDIEAKTLEFKARKIGARLLQTFPLIETGEIEIVKLSPPIPGIDGSCGVKYFFEK